MRRGIGVAGLTLGLMLGLASFTTASAASINVSPTTVHVGGTVTVSGDVLTDLGPRVPGGKPGCQLPGTVTLISGAFAGQGSFMNMDVETTAGTDGRFSVQATILSDVRPDTYEVTGRCGGGNLGVLATLLVIAGTPSPTPTPTPTVTPTPSPTPTVTRRILVPEVRDIAEDQACGTVEKARLRCTVNPTGSGPTPGTVTGQSPAPGTLVDPNTVVTLTVVRRIPVPDVRNLARDKACAAIRNARLMCVTQLAQGGGPPGQVLGQSPAPGTLVDDGALVTLQVQPQGQPVGQPLRQQFAVPGWVILAALGVLIGSGAAVQRYRRRHPPHSPHVEVRLRAGPPHVRGAEKKEW
jgi:PASTA domain-containing protein